MNDPSVSQHLYPHQDEPGLSRSGKCIAHKAFDAALERELQEVIREAKQKAGQIKEAADLWDLEHYLTQRRKEIDRKYDYRYSQLDPVFGRPLKEKRIDEEGLRCGPSVFKPKLFAGTQPTTGRTGAKYALQFSLLQTSVGSPGSHARCLRTCTPNPTGAGSWHTLRCRFTRYCELV